ncbi:MULTISPECIES: hypothetical protein [Klebsiella]|jgi:hypothetical protein|uniref:hypothetical protein n=1 Tax=Klebsiella TaxID=570 RepID=UPI00101D4CDC|nr:MULTISPECIES: hypothetical protein [Klebsiella]HBQ5884861.1 hypothetical protein [Klebsiella variicola subsp. variicola]ELA0489743.1 hypothetical protein [Klebsiella variicola]KAA0470182.1 hypothetical protein F0331_14305 [Klebsiella variicola]MBZ7122683.1 hypothetical protein [Klebsiella variicola]MCG5489473.1 hypothetical protein [Klebsiella variicola]
MICIRSLLILFLLSISGCKLLSPNAEYIPGNEALTEALVGKPYFFKIKILGGRVIGGPQRKVGSVVPDDAGISLRNCKLPESVITKATTDTTDHNCVEVYGVATKPGPIKITINGGMYGSMIAPASYFSKGYLLNVVKP